VITPPPPVQREGEPPGTIVLGVVLGAIIGAVAGTIVGASDDPEPWTISWLFPASGVVGKLIVGAIVGGVAGWFFTSFARKRLKSVHNRRD
jgi:hypothetical protein